MQIKMSSYIPPILSSSPPPMDAVDDDDDDFGDFAAVHYSRKEDNLVSKLNLDEPSWNSPDLNSPPTQPSTPVKQNGAIPNHTKSEISKPADWGAAEEEETQQQTDNTSQNSVVSGGSGITDSGLCSASQNSEGVSPLPQVDLSEDEAQLRSVTGPVNSNADVINGSSLVNVTVKDDLSRSDEGSTSEESNNGFISRRSGSPPDLDLDVNISCKPQECVGLSNTNNQFKPNSIEWGRTEDGDFGDFSSFDQPPLNQEDSPQSDLSLDEDVKEESLELKEDLKPLEFEPVQLEVAESTVGEEGVRTLSVKESDFNEFSDFEETCIPPKTEEDTWKSPVDGAGIEQTETFQDDEDDFADFESAQPASAPVVEKEVGSSFADFSTVSPEEVTSSASQWAVPAPAAERPPSGLSDTDSFGDFESDTFQPSFFTCDDVRRRLPEVLSSMFPPVRELDESVLSDESNRSDEMRLKTEDSSTWQALRDLESTPALSFHWPGSHANRCLLAALNIDSRNVLFGPKWSTVVPRFASNLSFSPLEPVRAGQMQTQGETRSKQPDPVLTPQSASQTPVNPLELQDVVPAAQFDWIGSGLENPLECKSKAETTTRSTTPPPSPSQTPSPLPLPLQPSIAPVTPQPKPSREPTLSPEAVRVLDSLPELAFLSAKKLMFPVYGEMAIHKQ